MQMIAKAKKVLSDPDQTKSFLNSVKNFLVNLLRAAILIGVGYVILSPVIGIIVNSISSNKDAYNPMVFVLPQFPTLERYALAIERMNYFPTMFRDLLYTLTLTALQLLVCSMVGYGFARFDFPMKKLLFGCVVVMIVIPAHTIMLPLYMTFKSFDPFGIVSAIKGTPGIMGTVVPMYIMTLLGCGVRSGLYIYIFNQFFRGLPKEIEEAALVDGCGVWYTYFRIMLINAMPAVITVAVFSIVWQFNDTFYAKLFLISEDVVISKKISSLQAVIANVDKILDTTIQELYLDAGIVLIILPILIIYLVLQKYFIEGVERSGIVG
ncbi:MAG: carbohydrate ABC transporter permease [Lachnospiraceae bacterium]|jgi:ABC-type glycerol-3-phosphate transport system permease component|nr:carbohydrate ABC transporter permease [Lachnospiraceae bacterium]CDA68958.1 binding-protein-dependent transport systems inner membrane component [Clostridium sp. CAG:510]